MAGTETKLAKGASAPRPRPAPRPMSRQRVGVSATQVWMHRIPISRSARATIGPRPMHILDAYRVELPRRRRAGPWVDHAAPCGGNAGAADDVAVEWNRIGGKSRAAGALRRACGVISRMWSGPAVPAVPRALRMSPRHTALSRSRFARPDTRHQNLAY